MEESIAEGGDGILDEDKKVYFQRRVECNSLMVLPRHDLLCCEVAKEEEKMKRKERKKRARRTFKTSAFHHSPIYLELLRSSTSSLHHSLLQHSNPTSLLSFTPFPQTFIGFISSISIFSFLNCFLPTEL